MSAGTSSSSSSSNPEVFARLASTCPSFRKLHDAADLTDYICASYKPLANESSKNANSSPVNASSSRPAPHDTTTALAFVMKEPKAVQQINFIRETRDRAFKRWMPHINFIFPFVHPAQFELIRDKIAKLNIQSFDIVFEKVDYFPQQHGQFTVHLRCNAESERKLVDVYNKILQACPEIMLKRSRFVPHLTLGQCQSSDLQDVVEMFTNAMPDVIKHRFAFDELHFLHRNPESGDKMVSRMSIGLTSQIPGVGVGVGGVYDGAIVENTSFLIESIGKYAITSKTTQPSIYLACIAEAVLLSKFSSAPIFSEHCGESIRSLFIQCIHGTAPEAIRDQALSSILTLFSCRNQIGLAWTLDNSSKSDRGVPTSSSTNSSSSKPTSGSNSNFFNNPENNKGLSYSSKPTNDNFIKLYINMIATEIHVTIEEFLFYLANPSPSTTATTTPTTPTTPAEGGSSTGCGKGTASTAVGGSSSESSGSNNNGDNGVSKRTARLNRCERAMYLLLLGTEFAVQFLVGPDEDNDDDEDDDKDIDFDGGVVDIDDDDCKDLGGRKPYIDSDDEAPDNGLGDRRYNSSSGGSKSGNGNIGNSQTASRADLAVDWTCVSFEIVESIQQALHSVANDIFEFIDQFRRSVHDHRKLESKWYSDNRVDLLLRRLLSVISLLAEEDVVIYRKFNNSITNILYFSELARYNDSVDDSIDFNEISANKVSDLAYKIFGYTSPLLGVNNNGSSSSSSSSSSVQKAWDDVADITIPAPNGNGSASVSDSDDIIGFYIIDVAGDSSICSIGNQCDLLYTIFPLLYSYLVHEDFGVDASFVQTFQVLTVHLLKTLHILLLFRSKRHEEFTSLKGPESDVFKLSTQFSIQILELLPKLLFNDSCDQSSSSTSLKTGVHLWEKVNASGKSAIRSRIDAVSKIWSSHLRKKLNGEVTSLDENEMAGLDETRALLDNFSKLCL